MDALWERVEFCGNVIMVGTLVLCGNGWSLWERYHGWHMDGLWERMEFVGTLSWLAHGCSVGTDGVCGNVIMVGTWMLCGNGWPGAEMPEAPSNSDPWQPKTLKNAEGLATPQVRQDAGSEG